MAVSSTTTTVSYTGDGSTTSFAVSFPFQGTGATAELLVIERVIATGVETVKSYSTHYTVTGGNGSTGTVVFGSAPADTVQIHIRRNTTRTQTVDYTANDPFPADTHELALDRLAMGMHEIQEELDRSFKVSRTNSITTPEFVDDASARASKLLGFSSDGNSIEATTGRVNSVSVSTSTVSAGGSATGSVTFTASTGALAFSLGIPTGATGATGSSGADGVFSAIASQSEAETGTENTKGMTALRTKQAVDSYGVITADDVGTTGANKILKLDGSGAISALSGANLTGIGLQGKQSIFVPAAAMRPTASNGCAAITDAETTAGRPDMQVLDFDASADEHAQFQIGMPKSWNEGTITFQVYWTSTATDTDGVTWGLQGVACSDSDTIDVAYGTAVTVDDANLSAAEDLCVSAESGAVTIAGSPAAGDMSFFRIFRDVSDSNDTAAEDARLIGVKLFITTDAGNDA